MPSLAFENMVILSAAKRYTRMGFSVFPCSREKQPLIKGWPVNASRDPEQLEVWWKQWPDADVGIACGEISGGLVVIDADVHKEKDIRGDRTIAQWQLEHGDFPETTMARTGSGGIHYYFQDPGRTQVYKNGVSVLPGVDIRTDGGYIVAPPSIHKSGAVYRWIKGHSPLEVGIKHVNDSVRELLLLSQSRQPKKQKHDPVDHSDLSTVNEGQRNQVVFRYACNQVGAGVPQTVAEYAALELNKLFSPPLDPAEVLKTVQSAYERYSPNSRNIVTNKGRTADYFVENYSEIINPGNDPGTR